VSGYVLDASATLAWAFDDEASPAVEQVLAEMAAGYAVVPALWSYELANGLVVGVRRARLSADDADAFTRDLATLDIRIDPDAPDPLLLASEALANGLSAYDASYLLLAQRVGLPLVTQDARGCPRWQWGERVGWGHPVRDFPADTFGAPVARVVVDVTLKQEILDPQGQAVQAALGRLGLAGVASVRQGKQFVIELEGDLDDQRRATLDELAGSLLSNPVIEDYTLTVEG